MMNRKLLRCEIERQKKQMTQAELYLNGGDVTIDGVTLSISEEIIGECALGRIDLSVENGELSECANLEAVKPVCVYLPLNRLPQNITALYMFNPWWTRPAFVQKPSDIPDRTQVALLQYDDRFACFMPMVGDHFKTYLTAGTDTEFKLVVSALHGGLREIREPLYLYAEAQSVDQAVTTLFTELARLKNIRLREQRRIPEMLRCLGWCSWDAFYTDVNEEGIRQKAAEFAQKNVPVKWMIIDDGWMSLENRLLYDFKPDSDKFPEGFRKLTEEIRRSAGVKWFGVWHALMGYWSGIAPGSPVALQEAQYLCSSANGRLVPDPANGTGFYRDWYKVLNDQGISFVKVDGQGTIPLCFENTMPLGDAAKGIHSCLESGASRMDGAVINCMGMAMENIVSRPATAVSRNSDDFMPKKENGFSEHLLQNAYNALYHDKLYCCDWDMFWTTHPAGAKHALLRAISGGPVYCSDRVGETDAEVLRPLAYSDGELLMMDRSARPTADCIFTDPMKSGYLKLQNIAAYGEGSTGGGIAVFNLSEKPISCTFSPAEVEGITACDRYLVYDYFAGSCRFVGRDERIPCTLAGDDYRWYVILPAEGGGICLGLTEKYAGFTAVESIHNTEAGQIVTLRESGPMAWVSERLPERVLVNGEDVTGSMRRNGFVTVVPLPERTGRAVACLLG